MSSTETKRSTETQHSTEKSFVITLGILIGLSPLAVDLYLPSMPTIAQDLNASPAAVTQTLSVYLACFALPQLVFGPLSDAWGRRFSMFTGLGIFLLGSIACALASDITELILARGLQGVGSAAIIVTVPALVRDRYRNEEFARIMGIVMMVMAIAPLVAPLVGGFILTLSGWRANFVLLAVLAGLSLLLFRMQIGETLARARRVPFRPATLLRNYGALVRHGRSLCFILCSGFAFGGMMSFLSASPFVYIELYGVSELKYGLLFACNILAMMAFTVVGNRFVRRTGSHRMLGLAMGVMLAATAVMLALMLTGRPPLPLVVVSVMLFVGTNGVISANSMALVMARFAAISGSASAMAGSMRFGAGALAGVVVSILHDGTAWPMFAVMMGCGAGAIVFYLLGTLLSRRHAETGEWQPQGQ